MLLGFIVILLFATYFSYSEYKKNSQNKIHFIILLRLIAILIIVFILAHPVLKIESRNIVKKVLNIYIDNSQSMKNNISLDSLNTIVDNIIKIYFI